MLRSHNIIWTIRAAFIALVWAAFQSLEVATWP